MCNAFLSTGTPEERGLIAWGKEMNLNSDPTTGEESSTYDFPIGMETLRKYDTNENIPNIWAIL